MLEAAATRIYNTVTLPTMSTGATDMAQLRAKGVQCFGIGAGDRHGGRRRKASACTATRSGCSRAELYRFVRYNYEVVVELARAR